MGIFDFLGGIANTIEKGVSNLVSGIEHLPEEVKNLLPAAEKEVSGFVSSVEHIIPHPSSTPPSTSRVTSPPPPTRKTLYSLTPTAEKSLKEEKKIPSYVPHPEISKTPYATKQGVYTPYGYFKSSFDYAKYLLWKFPDAYFPEIFKKDKELYNLYYVKHDYEAARELFRKKYANTLHNAITSKDVINRIIAGKPLQVTVQSKTVTVSKPPEAVAAVESMKPAYARTYHITSAPVHTAEIKHITTPERATSVEKTSAVSSLTSITSTIIPVMSIVVLAYFLHKVIREVRV